MDWKVGDSVEIKDLDYSGMGYSSSRNDEIGNVYKIDHIGEYSDIVRLKKSHNISWAKEWLNPAIIDNKLNRKLYPSRIEKDGFLVLTKKENNAG